MGKPIKFVVGTDRDGKAVREKKPIKFVVCTNRDGDYRDRFQIISCGERKIEKEIVLERNKVESMEREICCGY